MFIQYYASIPISISVSISVSISIYYLYVYLYVYLYLYIYIYLSIYIYIYLYTSISIYLSICLSLSLCVFISLSQDLNPPNGQVLAALLPPPLQWRRRLPGRRALLFWEFGPQPAALGAGAVHAVQAVQAVGRAAQSGHGAFLLGKSNPWEMSKKKWQIFQ